MMLIGSDQIVVIYPDADGNVLKVGTEALVFSQVVLAIKRIPTATSNAAAAFG